MSKWWALALAAAAAAGCTRHNEKFCCLSSEDCAAAGVDSEGLECAAGLSCVDHVCQVPTCNSGGCTSSAPICDIRTDVCTGCLTSNDCARFTPRDVCDAMSGSCVECLGPTDCGGAAPVCEGNACRACKSDTECASGACDEDGSCVDEQSAVYISPQGVDVAPCTKAAPCQDPRFAFPLTSAQRSHLVLLKDVYTMNDGFLWSLYPSGTTASLITVHGGGSRFVANSGDGLLHVQMPAIIRDLELINTNSASTGSPTITASSSVTLTRMIVRGLVRSSGAVTFRDSTVIAVSNCAVSVTAGSLTVDRATISGGDSAVCTGPGTFVTIANLLVTATPLVGLDLTGASGTVAFSTVTSTGYALTAPGAAGITCGSSLSISSSIVWTPEAGNQPAISGPCSLSSTIAGPVGIGGAMNVDPKFTNAAGFDFHLHEGSPAIDKATQGPSMDFEGERRPRGAGYDLGADEAL